MINKYNLIADKIKVKENKFSYYIKAFVVGGLIGLLANFLLDFYSYIFSVSSNSASIFMITTFIFIACLFTAMGFFDKFVTFSRMGLIIPITGFAHSMQSESLDYKNEGLINGIGSNMLKLASSVIVYGVLSAYVFGVIRYFLEVLL